MIPEPRSARWGYILSLCLLGAYANIAAYGFSYPKGADYDFLLPLANWLGDHSLYPGDPIREAFVRHQSLFWPIVSKLCQWSSREHVLFALFLLTKLVFFLAIGRLVAAQVREKLLGACIVAAVALSGMLNGVMPFGGSGALAATSEQGGLGIAMLLLTGTLLAEGRWWIASIMGGLSLYIDALQFVHTLPAFAIFAIVDWREQKSRICIAALLGAGISVPWLVLSYHSLLGVIFPKDYVGALLMFFPLHSTLRWTPASQLLKGGGVLVGTAWVGFVARRSGLNTQRRLELLAVSYFIPLLLGVFLGELFLTPNVARMCLLRADSFLIPYALLLTQIYGAHLLASRNVRCPKTTFLVGVLSLLLPLSVRMVAPPFFLALILWTDPRERFERLCQKFSGLALNRFFRIPMSQSAPVLCGLGVILAFLSLIRSPVRLWNVVKPIQPDERACYEAQLWARAHTPREARFLVPQTGCGFRVFSERSSWGEWADGNAVFFYPPFADVFLRRMAAFGLRPGPTWPVASKGFLEENYMSQSWDRVRAIAMENHLDYIVQFRSAPYPVTPVYENIRFAIYEAK